MKKQTNSGVSLIMMVKNESKNIGKLFESILSQTKLPEEIIVINNNSEDDTVKIIKSFKKKFIKVIDFGGDLGSGRNLAIKTAKNEIVACTDGGCVLDSNWLEEITFPFRDRTIDVVGGVFKPMYNSFFEKCEGVIVCKDIADIDEKKFLPSSRSIAFRKSAWQAVNGYPLHNIGGEDTLYVLKLKEFGCKFFINKKAIVYWRMRSPLRNFLRQFYLYAVGDAKNKNIIKMKANLLFAIGVPAYLFVLLLSVFFSPILFAILLAPSVMYFLYAGIIVAIKVKDFRGFFYGITLLLSKRLAYVYGIWREWIWPYRGKYRNENIKS